MPEYKVIVGELCTIWYKPGTIIVHRLDGPAYESRDFKAWYVEGKRHRLDGPACEGIDGFKSWYQNGILHRLDGPAVEHANGDKEWLVEGKKYTQEEFKKLTALKSEEEIITLNGKKYKLIE